MLSSIKLLGFLSTLLAISAYKCGGYPTASSGVIGHRRQIVKQSMRNGFLDNEQQKLGLVVGSLTATASLLVAPTIASAIAEPSAREALQLLGGYQTHTPYWFTWGTLAVLVYVLAFEIWKKIIAAW